MALFAEYASTGSDYDANSALAELDRALRSSNIGEKAELIVRVPFYFEKYPFPVFVNAVFLKLTELFRGSTTNFLRKLVLQVAERSETHLDKIISHDEISKRVLTVSYSNDPVARAITLKLLGCLSGVLCDRKQIHHLIRTSLDSHDNDELFAAIFAAKRFAGHSTEFANAISEKVAEMLESAQVVSSTKIALLPILQHVHNDPHTTEKIFELCQLLVERNTHDRTFICSVFDALTELALSSLIIFSPLMDLLFDTLVASNDFAVKMTVAKCLKKMVKDAPHFWDKNWFEKFIGLVQNFDPNLKTDKLMAVKVTEIMSCAAFQKTITTWGSLERIVETLLSMCSKLSVTQTSVVLLAPLSTVLAGLLYTANATQLDGMSAQNTVLTLSNFLPMLSRQTDNSERTIEKNLKVFIRSLITMCSKYREFTISVCNAICVAAKSMQSCRKGIVFLTLCSLNDCDSSAVATVIQLLPDSLSDIKNKLSLIHLPSSDALTNEPGPSIDYCSSSCDDGWSLYKIGRFASRYGKHFEASAIYEKLKNMAVADYNLHWLKFLAQMSVAESMISQKKCDLSQVLSAYNRANFYLKAAATPAHSMWFAAAYFDLRVRFLGLVKQLTLLWCSNKHKFSPTPKISCSTASAHLTKFLNEIQTNLSDATNLSQDYENLSCKCFDVDHHTLEYLELDRRKVLLIRYWLLLILNRPTNKEAAFLSSFNDSHSNACNRFVWKCVKAAVVKIDSIKEKFDDSLCMQVLEPIMNSVESLAKIRLCVPRYVFQALQCTTVRLVLSPQPTGSDQAISVPGDQGLVIKVEGVIQTKGSKPLKARRLARVVLSVQTEFTGGPVIADDGKTLHCEQRMEKHLTPHNDYFSAEFVLHFPQHGLITVRADILDHQGRLWKLGIEEKLKVKRLGGVV